MLENIQLLKAIPKKKGKKRWIYEYVLLGYNQAGGMNLAK